MEFFGKLSEELTNTFVRPYANLIELEEQESGGVVFRADTPDTEEEFEEQDIVTKDYFLKGVSEVFGFPIEGLKKYSIDKIEVKVELGVGFHYLNLKLHPEGPGITVDRDAEATLLNSPIFAKLQKFKLQQGAV
eukprot:GHVP01027650.1.p1 GENE.GHVP01027650.1~~GHVP01027650.1.p1  ORF type:complete len:143 (+),score=23.60 GHVP01027650.1:28-429(+)